MPPRAERGARFGGDEAYVCRAVLICTDHTSKWGSLMTNSPPSGSSAGDGSPQADSASDRADDTGKPSASASGAAAPDLSEQLLSDYDQIIRQIAAAQPSAGDRVIFAKHLIQAALDEQGFPHAAEQLRKEHHPLGHVMTEIHDYVKKHPPGYIFGLICMIIPALVPVGLLGQAPLPPPTPSLGPQVTVSQDDQETEKAIFLTHSQPLVGIIKDRLAGEPPGVAPRLTDVWGLGAYVDAVAHSSSLGLTPEQLTQFDRFTPEQRAWLTEAISGELASRSAPNSVSGPQPVFPESAEGQAHPSPADPQ